MVRPAPRDRPVGIGKRRESNTCKLVASLGIGNIAGL